MNRPAAPILILLICAVACAGCFLLDERQPAPAPTVIPSPLQTIDSGMASVDPSGMALQLTDLPPGYIVRERADIAYSDISSLAREQGWKRGYFVSYYRMKADQYDITAISQRIGVYQIDNVHLVDRAMGQVFESEESGLRGTANASVTVTELPFPKTGDQTSAFRILDTQDPYQVTRYVVLFTKKNVIESIEMRGTTTDFEVLKTLVRTAEGKIR